MLQEIKDWLQNQDYDTGYLLLLQCKPGTATTKLLGLGPTKFNRLKLRELLQIQLISLEKAVICTNSHRKSEFTGAAVTGFSVDESKHLPEIKTDAEPATLPEIKTDAKPATPAGETLEQERSRLFKESAYLHSQLGNAKDAGQRKDLAFQILTNFDRNQEIWDMLAFQKAHGFLPNYTPTPALEKLVPEELRRQLLCIRPKVSKLKKQLPKRQAEYDALLNQKFKLEQELDAIQKD